MQGSKKFRRSERLRCQISAVVKTFNGQIGTGVIEAQESESFVSQRVSGVRFVLESQRFKGQTYQETLNYATQKTDSAELMCARKFQMQFLNLLKLRWLKKQ